MSAMEEIVTNAAQSLMDAYRQGVIDGKTEGYDEGYRKGYQSGRGLAAWSNLQSHPTLQASANAWCQALAAAFPDARPLDVLRAVLEAFLVPFQVEVSE